MSESRSVAETAEAAAELRFWHLADVWRWPGRSASSRRMSRPSTSSLQSKQERRGCPGHRLAEATPSFGRLCPGMTRWEVMGSYEALHRQSVLLRQLLQRRLRPRADGLDHVDRGEAEQKACRERRDNDRRKTNPTTSALRLDRGDRLQSVPLQRSLPFLRHHVRNET